MFLPTAISLLLSYLGYLATGSAITATSELFINKGLFGKDLLKKDKPLRYLLLTRPEAMGVIIGTVYFICLFLFLPFPFLDWVYFRHSAEPFPFQSFAQLLGGLLSLFSMFFLGFADDVLDIKWRVKVWLPLIASIPLMMVYFVTNGQTDVFIPSIIRKYLQFKSSTINFGLFYYLYIAALTTFSTNSINILAGILKII
jgi:UDP-N-acetylglucosamine--dolichyl-phosphate N-acetylglucosaminephosphotransferase